jgi:hypothetical protein
MLQRWTLLMVVPPSVADNATPDVSIAKLFRAWLVSTLACAGLLALWGVVQAVLYGGTAHLWLNVINLGVFHDSDDPQTLGAWIRFWTAHVPPVLVAILPFAVAGAVFGLLWPGTRRRT